ncbi:metallophosphoesterase [bacterium]|nr:metallophosphoesterase [bacterium]
MIRLKSGWLIFMLTVVMLICARDVNAVPLDISGIVFQDANANGRLDADEHSLPEVVISDGVQVVRGDRWGRYRLSTESSRVLFVCPPGDYRANGEFFEYLLGHRNGDIVDFPLVKHDCSDTFCFLFFTDSHVTAEEKFNAVAGMKAAVAHMSRQEVDLVISGGDLIMDALRACEPEARAQYQLYQELVSPLKVPLFNAVGNHELYGVYLEGVGEDPCIVEEDDPLYGMGMYREYLGPDHYSFNWGPYHFVVLNTLGLTRVRNSRGDTIRTYYGTVGPEQIEWLQRDLQMVPAEAPIVLVGHIPFVSLTLTFEGYHDWQVIDYDLEDPKAKSFVHTVNNTPRVINEVLAGRRIILALAGHHHNYEVSRWGDNEHDLTFVTGGSICGQWWAGDRRIAGSSWPEGYVLVRLKDGRLDDLRYVSYGWRGYKERQILDP